MEASIVDLRYKMNKVLKALDRRETVKILYHGKVKGIILPVSGKKGKTAEEHPLFGMSRGKRTTVATEMRQLRKGRFSAV